MRWLVLLGLAGCFSWKTEGLGPAFREETSRAALIYVYRPSNMTMVVRPIHVVIDGTERTIYAGSYAAFEVPPGDHEVLAYSTPASQTFVAYGFGPTKWMGHAKVAAAAGAPGYVRVVSAIGAVKTVAVGGDDAATELRACHLAPGGRVSVLP